MIGIYKSKTNKKEVEIGIRPVNGRIPVFFRNFDNINDPFYIIDELSSKNLWRLSGLVIVIYYDSGKKMLKINEWPEEEFIIFEENKSYDVGYDL